MAHAAPAAPAADWEASKENFQPLKAGRKAAGLRDTTAELRAVTVEERRRAFWEELAGYSGDDPLEVWLRFIKWTQEFFSAGGHKAELLPLLERCTRELQSGGRYSADIRYLRVWIQYADCLPDPGDVFCFLKENDIGQDHALYYVAYATYLEARGGYAKADAVYQQGIDRLAAPVERLRGKFAEFQQRMARRIQRKAAEQSVGEVAEPEQGERRSLGVLGGRGGANSRPPAGAPAGRSGASLLGGGLLGKRKVAAGAEQENAPGGGLDIFVDDEFNGTGAPAASAPAMLFQPGRSAAAGAWTKLGGFEAGRKENVQRSAVWAGQKVKQAAAHSAPAAPALEIFADPELQDLEERAHEASTAGCDAGRPTLRQRLDRGGQEEEIMHDPLHLHKAQASGPLLGGVPGRSAAGQPPEAKRRREEVMGFDETALAGDSGEELCFEEMRAVRWQQKEQLRRQEEAAAGAAREEDDMDLEGETCAVMEVAAKATEGASVPAEVEAVQASPSPATAHISLQVETGPGELLAAESAFGSPVATEVVGTAPQPAEQGEQEQKGPAADAEQASGTAEMAEPAAGPTDAAMPASDAAEQLAARPTPFEQPAEAVPGGDMNEPTVTFSTADAFAAINQMFGGALPAGSGPADMLGAGTGSRQAGGLAAMLEPTMTIATKDAFSALNRMFKGSLPLEHGTLPPNPYAEPTMNLSRSGSGYEPTMTFSTKAAFDAINNMFKGSLPHEHGALPPTARGPAGYEPTVTISTKAAFDAINQMFGGIAQQPGSQPAAAAQQQQQQGGFRVPAPRPPRAPAAMPAAPAASEPDSPGDFGVHEDTQFVSVPLEALEAGHDSPSPAPAAATAPAASPGGLFGGFDIREDTQFVTVPAGADAEEVEEEMGGSGADGSAGRRGASPGGLFGGFSIREDTQFVTVPMQPEEEEEEAQQQQQAAAAPAEAAPAAGGFCIREDTLFLGGDAAPSPEAAQAPSPAAVAAAAHSTDADAAAGGGFCIREDTQFLGGGLSSPCASSEAGGSTGDLLDTELGGLEHSAGSPALSAAAMQVNKWGFAPGADDTLALNLDSGDTMALLEAVSAAGRLRPAAAAQHLEAAGSGAAAGSPVAAMEAEAGGAPTEDLGLQMGMQGLRLADCKENLPAVGGHRGRQLSDRAVAAGVLQPLADARVGALGATIEADEAAEAALATAAETAAEVAAGEGGAELARQDSFMVWADADSHDASPSPTFRADPGSCVAAEAAAGAEGFATPVARQPADLVDPFSPAFHGCMLACLDPAVPEWPGVYCLSAEEEAVADAAFRAVERSAAELEELQLCGLEFAVSGCTGEGAYAKVYQGVDGDCADVALKREAPPCPWEWYICKALAGRVPEGARHRFIDPTALLLGGRSSVLVAPMGPHGSLQELVNAYLGRGQTPPECLAMHLAVDLLCSMQHLHAARILHTDIKPDNLLVTLGQGDAGGDENAGPCLGLQLIDFGRSVDLDLLPEGALLQGDSCTDAFRCVEMREGTPWVWQADAYGAAACVHALLFGRYMEVERVRDSSTGTVALRLTQPFKRQWAGDLWGALFHRLLNHSDPSSPPAVGDLVAALQAHLSGSRDVAQRLRKELADAAAMLPNRC